jgi:hypothetical protein
MLWAAVERKESIFASMLQMTEDQPRTFRHSPERIVRCSKNLVSRSLMSSWTRGCRILVGDRCFLRWYQR